MCHSSVALFVARECNENYPEFLTALDMRFWAVNQTFLWRCNKAIQSSIHENNSHNPVTNNNFARL